MEVKSATEEDAEELLSLQRAAFLSEAKLYNDYEIPPLTQSLEELKADFKRKTILKVVKEKNTSKWPITL